ncbi:tautomerase family protein [Kiloniella sp.]|uniref:tautomerase family protein n=1 Tax=Kiloniella sp. TaxID=1938587 RepID=UPI003B014784
MPFVSIALMAGRPEEQKQAVARRLSEIMKEEMGVAPEHLWIRFDDTQPHDWFTGPSSEAEISK